MSEKDDQSTAKNNQNTSVKNWLIGGGAVALLGALAPILTPLPELIESLKPGENEPPVAKIRVIQPASYGDIDDGIRDPVITIAAGGKLSLVSKSFDAQDGSALEHIWSVNSKEYAKDTHFDFEFPSQGGIYSVTLKVTDRRNTEGILPISVKVIDNPQEALSYQWTKVVENNMPANAFVAAEELTSEIEGSRYLFLCRAEVSGRKVPGKVVKGLCNIPSYRVENGEINELEEKLARDYEVLVSEREISWEKHDSHPGNGTGLPEGVLMSDDRALTVICRVNYSQDAPDHEHQETGSGKHPGILEPSLGLCLFPWGGTVKSSSNYEILVAKP